MTSVTDSTGPPDDLPNVDRAPPSNTDSSTTAAVSQSPSPPAIEYVYLRPKPPPQSARLSREARLRRQKQRSCKVKFCPVYDCRLRSHRDYRPPTATKSETGHVVDTQSTQLLVDTRDELLQTYFSRTALWQGGIDGSPPLPLDGLESSVFRELFHNYFDYQFDRVYRILEPPPLSAAQKRMTVERKERALAMALSDPVYCLYRIAHAHQQVIYRRDYRITDPKTVLLQGRVMALLRTKLDDFSHAEIGDVLLVIFVLVTIELAMGRSEALKPHRKAVHHLITTNGGVHKLKRPVIAIFLHLDRFLSMFTCEPMLYTPPANNFVRKPRYVPVSYGAYLEDPGSRPLLGPRLHQYCLDTCRVIEIFEWEGWTFDPRGPDMSADTNIHYFFYYRECVLNEFVRLNLESATKRTIGRCVLLTAKIVEYAALSDNLFPPISLEMADRIQKILDNRDVKLPWDEHGNTLIWILFVLTSMAFAWQGRPWAMHLLRQQLELKYPGDMWPPDWRRFELDNVHRFVWANSRFFGKFIETCTELQHSPGSSDSEQMQRV